MSIFSWIGIAVWVTAFVLQCGRFALKHDPKRERAYRALTVATFAAVILGVALQAGLAVATGSVVPLRGAFIGLLIVCLLFIVS